MKNGLFEGLEGRGPACAEASAGRSGGLEVAAEASARFHDGFGMAAALHFHGALYGLDVGEGAIRIADGIKRLPRPP